MSRSQVVKRFTYVEKMFLIALLGAAGSSILQVLAVNSVDNQSLFLPPNAASSSPTSWFRSKLDLKEWQYRGVHAAVFSSIGKRSAMEDTFTVEENIKNLPISLYGVFDGHGGDGSSKYAARHLIDDMIKKLRKIKKNIRKGRPAEYTENGVINYISFLAGEIEKFETKLLAKLQKDGDGSGTTALIALMVERMLYIANIGDSRAVRDDDIQITNDHQPQIEQVRIERGGNTIWQYPGQQTYRVGEQIVDNDGYTTYNGLSTSRTLGDLYLKGIGCGLIADPDIFAIDLSQSEIHFVILASDGLWGVMSNAEAVQVVRDNFNDGLFGAEQLVNAAKSKPKFSDNITVVVINTRQDQDDHNNEDDQDNDQDDQDDNQDLYDPSWIV